MPRHCRHGFNPADCQECWTDKTRPRPPWMRPDGGLTEAAVAEILAKDKRAPKYGEPLATTLDRWANENRNRDG